MDLATTRLRNALLLRDHFATKWRAESDPRAQTSESSFAQLVGISPSHWSQIKSGHRHLGEKLARQIEVKCHVPTGALDAAEALSSTAQPSLVLSCQDDDERRAIVLFQGLYRSNPAVARHKLLAALQDELLDRPEGATSQTHPRSVAQPTRQKKR